MTVATDPRKTGVTAGATLLAASAVAASLTGSTSETALATITIPAGAMGLNGGVEVRSVWSMTNNANTKTPRVRFGGAAGTQYAALAATTSSTVSDVRRIRNRNAANSQVGAFPAGGSVGLGANGNAVVTSSVDTSAAVDIVLSGQLGSAADTITLESYEVWLVP